MRSGRTDLSEQELRVLRHVRGMLAANRAHGAIVTLELRDEPGIEYELTTIERGTFGGGLRMTFRHPMGTLDTIAVGAMEAARFKLRPRRASGLDCDGERFSLRGQFSFSTADWWRGRNRHLPLTDDLPSMIDAVGGMRPAFSPRAYRHGLQNEDPVGYITWAGLDEQTWQEIANGLNGLLDGVVFDERDFYESLLEQGGPDGDTEEWLWRTFFVCLVFPTWSEIRDAFMGCRLSVRTTARTLRRCAEIVRLVAQGLDSRASNFERLRRPGQLDRRVNGDLKRLVKQCLPAAKAWNALDEARIAPLCAFWSSAALLEEVPIAAMRAVYEELDVQFHRLDDNHGRRDPRVEQWWKSWANNGFTTINAAWVDFLLSQTELDYLLHSFRQSTAAWSLENCDARYALDVLRRPSNQPHYADHVAWARETGSEPPQPIGIDQRAVHAGFSCITNHLERISSAGMRGTTEGSEALGASRVTREEIQLVESWLSER